MGKLLNAAGRVYGWARRNTRKFFWILGFVVAAMLITLAGGKTYQHLDQDPDRGAIPIQEATFSEDYSTPVYLDQGWSKADSLWYYNTTQGSNLLPYDFFIVLEEADSEELLRSNANMDRYRYLPQKKTFFNPDALPVGFVKDNYDGKDYMGFTCAACHTGQINFRGQAIRIDGGPAMADMPLFLAELAQSLSATLENEDKKNRFVKKVLALKNDYRKADAVIEDLAYWVNIRQQYDIINHSKVDYGYARLDAFGRIYNRVLQYIINRDQVRSRLLTARDDTGERILSIDQVDLVLDGVDSTIVGRDNFLMIVDRLMSDEAPYPGLDYQQMLHLRDELFNEPNAPVSYPFLWDTTHSDYVQWNGIAKNSGAGPLGRNVGEVMGVFATLDWTAKTPWYAAIDIPARVSGQERKAKVVNFKSSVDLVNLERLESQLKSLKSPLWPEDILGEIDWQLAEQGQPLYAEYCQSCHEVIDRNNWDRIIVGQMSAIENLGTDPAMAENSVNYAGASGNFVHTYQNRDVGGVIVQEEAPVAMILTSATSGVVATPDSDKNFFRRQLDWLYLMAMSFFQNTIEASVKSGDYNPDTTASPFASLLSYKARPLNGIWATAPYLHNGSVPTLYDLLLPAKREGDPEEGEYRPDKFIVGSREFDPVKVGFKSAGYEGFRFVADQRGNLNTGHEYAAGRTPRADGKVLPPLSEAQRWALLEYLKTL